MRTVAIRAAAIPDMSDRDAIARWVRPEIRALSAYHVPDSTGLIKLDAMENPYTWPEDLRREWLELICQDDNQDSWSGWPLKQ